MSIIIGVILAMLCFYNNCISYLINGSRLVPLSQIPMLIIYYLLVSVCEEFVFRGYIGTRIYGFFNNEQKNQLVIVDLIINVTLVRQYYLMERKTGIEPAYSAWEADVLPLNYFRIT